MNSNWSYSPETPNLGQIRRFFTSVTLTFDLWPWPFARTSLLSLVITPENLMMVIGWQEHCQKGVTDGQTDTQTEIAVLRAARLQLKNCINLDWRFERKLREWQLWFFCLGYAILPIWYKFKHHDDATVKAAVRCKSPLQWRHNEHDGVSNHQSQDCLLNRLVKA